MLLALLLVCWSLGAPTASAHNVLRSSDPADGSALTTPPAELTLVFNDVVLAVGSVFQVTGPDGVLQVEAPVVDGPTVVQPLPEGLPAGAYSVIWRVTSADGHPIDGTLAFTADQGTVPAPSTQTSPAADPATAPTDEPAGEPSDEPATDEALADEAGADDGAGATPWVVAGVLLLAAAAAAWLLLRRRSAP